MLSAVADVARPPHAVFLRGDERELESNDGCGVAPMRLCCRGGDYEAARERSGSSGFTLSGGVRCRNGTTARGPA